MGDSSVDQVDKVSWRSMTQPARPRATVLLASSADPPTARASRHALPARASLGFPPELRVPPAPCALANGVLRPRARSTSCVYEITQKLGKGAYAVVFKGVEKKSK